MDRANRASAAVPRKLGFVLDRAEDRPIQTPGHTGHGVVWAMPRDRWRDGPTVPR
jgi:RimJ/RimL family protein N-acetyltransferase